jgi:hypothetical protein
MKIYNNTAVPDDLLYKVIAQAGKQVGAKIGKVVVKITRSRLGLNCSGLAHFWYGVNLRWLNPRKYKQTKYIKCNGCFELRIPKSMLPESALIAAELIYEYAAHEWSHIKDYQEGTHQSYKKGTKWANRACERKAQSQMKDAVNEMNSKTQDAILDLAIWLEAESKE